jgi:hypothetical protein
MNNLRRRIPITTSSRENINTTTRVNWISTRDARSPLPAYGQKVLLCRPNKSNGEQDILIGRLEPAQEEGVRYGKLGEERLTYDDYWVIPGSGVFRFDVISHWAEKPIPPPKY